MSAIRGVVAVLLLGLVTAPAVARDFAVVAHKSNATESMTAVELTKICKGQTNRWPDGKPVMFVTRDPALPEMKLLLDKVYALSGSEVGDVINAANHGRAEHPAVLVVGSDQAVLNRVGATPGAIGLVDVYAINSSVKIVKVGGKLPLERGYLLHGN